MKVIVGKFFLWLHFCCHRRWTKRFSTSFERLHWPAHFHTSKWTKEIEIN